MQKKAKETNKLLWKYSQDKLNEDKVELGVIT